MVVGEFTQEARLVVIGAGPAGYEAAFRAAERGLPVVLVDDRPEPGGVCLHAGCIPSTSILHVATLRRRITEAPRLGLRLEGTAEIDPEAVRDTVRRNVDALAKGLSSRMRDLGIERMTGQAVFEDGKHLAIHGGSVPRIRFRRAILATGSRAAEHPRIPFEADRVVDPETAVRLERASERVAVVGSGYLAAEAAAMQAAFGATVTLLVEHGRLLPEADEDLVAPLRKSLRRSGVRLVERAEVVDAAAEGDRRRLAWRVDEAEPIADAFDLVITAGERAPRIEGLDLERTGVTRNRRGFIAVDDRMRTSDPRILAAGDVTGPPCLAHHALAQGRIAGEIAADPNAPVSFAPTSVPRTVYTDPELAWCGWTEGEARADGLDFAVVTRPWGFSGRAVAALEAAGGLTKIIYDRPSEAVLGVGFVGPGATELVSAAVLALEMGAVLTDLDETVHPHPTVSELLGDAAGAALVERERRERAGEAEASADGL